MLKQRAIFWVSLAALPFLAFVLMGSLSRRQGLIEEVRLLGREADTLARENEQLKSLVDSAQSDVLKELEVRRKFNYAKPGEVLVLFVSPSPSPSAAPELPWWKKLFP